MGHRYVKTLGTAIAVVGLLLIVAGLGLYYYKETERTWSGTVVTKPYEDTGAKMYDIGFYLSILGAVVYAAGFFLKPSMFELRLAQRMIDKNWNRLASEPNADGTSELDGPDSPTPSHSKHELVMKYCNNCGNMILGDSTFCERCGRTRTLKKMGDDTSGRGMDMQCVHCGLKNPPNARFCLMCGALLGMSSNEAPSGIPYQYMGHNQPSPDIMTGKMEKTLCRMFAGIGWLVVAFGTFIIAFGWLSLLGDSYDSEGYMRMIGYGMGMYGAAALLFSLRAFIRTPS